LYIYIVTMPKKVYAKKRRPTRRPRGKYTKRAYRRRPYIANNLSGMPKTRRAILRYADQLGLTSSTGSLASHVFRANSIYDPDYTAAGHQPMGHDQWAALYNHYVVLGSKLTVRFIPNASSTAPCAMGTYLTDGTAVPYTTPSEFIEAKRGNYKIFKATDRAVTLIQKYSAKKQYNVADVKDNVGRIGAAMDTNPSDEAFFNIWFDAIDGSTSTCVCMVYIDYIVLYSEPKDMPTS